MTDNLYRATKDWPAHLSVGAVLINGKQEVAVHYFSADFAHPWVKGNELMHLSHETMHDDESPEAAVHRGLGEEFGAQGEIIAYLDSERGDFTSDGRRMWKTTLYFLVKLISLDPAKREPGDIESGSEIRWLTFNDAIAHFRTQAKLFPDRPDLHEAAILEKARAYISTTP